MSLTNTNDSSPAATGLAYRFVNTPFDTVLNKSIKAGDASFAVPPILSMLRRFEELTSSCREIVVLEGMPASGKTTLLSMMQQRSRSRLSPFHDDDTQVLYITEPKSVGSNNPWADEENASAYWDNALICDGTQKLKPLKYMYMRQGDQFCQEIVQLFLLMAKLRKCLDRLEACASRPPKIVYIERFIFADLWVFPFLQDKDALTTKSALEHEAYIANRCDAQVGEFIRQWNEKKINIFHGSEERNKKAPTERITEGVLRLALNKFRFIFKGIETDDDFKMSFERLTGSRSTSNKGYFVTREHQRGMCAAFRAMAKALFVHGFPVKQLSASY